MMSSSYLNVSAESLTDLERQKIELEEQKNGLKEFIQDKDIEIQGNTNEINSILEQIQSINNEIASKNNAIGPMEDEIYQTMLEVETLYEEVIGLQSQTTQREKVLDGRMRAMQVNGGTVSYIDVLLGSSSFADFIDRMSAVNTLMKADQAILTQQEEDQEILEETKSKVDNLLLDQRNRKNELQTLVSSLDTLKEEKNSLVSTLEKEQDTLQAEKDVLEEAYDEKDKMSAEVEASIVEEQKRIFTSEMNQYTAAYCQSNGTVNSQMFDSQFTTAGKLAGTGSLIMKIANEQGIDPVLMAAIALHETGNGKSNAVKMYNNPGGLMAPSSNWSQLTRFETLEDGLVAMGKTLKRLILIEGKSTIKELGSAYAPLGADNDPLGLNDYWVPNVTKKVAELGGLTVNCADQFTGAYPNVDANSFWTTPAPGRLTSQFGWRVHPIFHTRKEHRGLDIANVEGTSVVAAGDGTVIRAESHKTYGNMVMVSHNLNGQVYTTVYAHMSALNINKGDKVSKGQLIGKMGKTGTATGFHLHFEFHEGYYSAYGPSAVNPLRYVSF